MKTIFDDKSTIDLQLNLFFAIVTFINQCHLSWVKLSKTTQLS